jgi:chromosome segregation ATPase
MTDEADSPEQISHLQKKISSLENQMDRYKKHMESRFQEIVDEMSGVTERTDKIENLAEDLAKMIRDYKEQLDRFQGNLVELTKSISELRDSKKMMEETRKELKNQYTDMNDRLSGLFVQQELLKGVPEQMNQMAITLNNTKTVTDSIKSITKLFLGAVVVLVVNTLFGDIIVEIVQKALTS